MLIKTGTLTRQSLAGQVAIVTGAGRGIGLETARALIWLGAQAVVAEIDENSGREAAERLSREFGKGRAVFIQTDVGSEPSVDRLKRRVLESFGGVDIVINNATITPMGAVKDVPVSRWDASYHVNLRGPVLLAQTLLPGMVERDYGVFVCVSSVGEAYMGAYETFKAAQVHLASTLDAELEGTGVHVFTIDPGLVRTPGLHAAVDELAPLYGKTVEEFQAISHEHELTAEAAGAGFAAAVALASRFRGQEISSKQALLAAGIDLLQEKRLGPRQKLDIRQVSQASELCRRVRQTLKEQSEGWAERSLFERHWMFRDFKKNAGMPVERWLETLREVDRVLGRRDRSALMKLSPPVGDLASYYRHLGDLARGYEQDQDKLEEQLRIIKGWQDEADQLKESLSALMGTSGSGIRRMY
jgi:NAD(P)-dependent dehydrogenase (short-subunit alcohol dehydrogenase family)